MHTRGPHDVTSVAEGPEKGKNSFKKKTVYIQIEARQRSSRRVPLSKLHRLVVPGCHIRGSLCYFPYPGFVIAIHHQVEPSRAHMTLIIAYTSLDATGRLALSHLVCVPERTGTAAEHSLHPYHVLRDA